MKGIHKISLQLIIAFTIWGSALSAHAQIAVKTYYDYDKGVRQVKEEYFILDPTDSLKEGPYFSYYKDGAVKSKGFFVNGLRDSTFTEFYENGIKKMEAQYRRGRKNGLFVAFKENGLESQRAWFIKDKLQDTIITYYPTGAVKSKSFFFNDYPDGELKYYYPDGKLKQTIHYKYGKPNGLSTEYYPSGQKSLETELKDGYPNGFMRTWYPNGQLETESVTLDGKKNGVYREYNRDGTLIKEGFFTSGKLNGISKQWYANGKPMSIVPYEMGRKTKEALWFYKSGELQERIQYLEKEVDRDHQLFAKNGKVVKKYSIRSGRKFGEWWTYDSLQGLPKSLETYDEKGQLNGPKTDFDSLGNKKLETGMFANQKHGVQTLFYQGGTLPKEKITFDHNRKTGAYSLHYNTGNAAIEGNYVLGKENGLWEYFNEQGLLTKQVWYKNGVVTQTKEYSVPILKPKPDYKGKKVVKERIKKRGF